MKRAAATTAAIAVLLTAGCSSGEDDGAAATPAPATSSPVAEPSPEPTTINIQGVVGLPFVAYVALEIADGASACQSAGPDFSAIEPGVQVQARDSAGAIVGTTELGEGTLVLNETDSTPVGCQWPYQIEAEAGGKFYTVKVLDWETDAVAETSLATDTLNLLPYDMK